jgi:NADP-dependent 3-hydroxy acid dehydrogenase YdfG
MIQKKVALVTGASSGIGASAATLLAEKGYHVLATARTVEKLEKIKSERIEPLHLDVSDSESIKKAFSPVTEKRGRTDVLVNNADYADTYHSKMMLTAKNLLPDRIFDSAIRSQFKEA